MTTFPLTISYNGPFGMLIDFLLLTATCCITVFGMYFLLSKILFKDNNLHREVTLRLTMLWSLLALLILLNLFLGFLFYFTGWDNLNFGSLGTYLALAPFLAVYSTVVLAFFLVYRRLHTKPL